MKSIRQVIEESKIIESSVFDDDQDVYTYHPKTPSELRRIIDKKIEDEGLECDLNDIDTSGMTDMRYTFGGNPRRKFNGDISGWDVSNVIYMGSMFSKSEFNGDISKWDVHNVKEMDFMFYDSKFNNDISKWDVSQVERFPYMFCGSQFNQDIGDWDISSAKTMQYMFQDTHYGYGNDLSRWKIPQGCDTKDMFARCTLSKRHRPQGLLNESSVFDDDQEVFAYRPQTRKELVDIIEERMDQEGTNCDLNDIDVSKITDMNMLFSGLRKEFNGDISSWDVSNVTNMRHMFMENRSFNGDISKWDTHNVKGMTNMFNGSVFNGDISKWDTHNVKFMNAMFRHSKFNGDISKWDVSQVEDFGYMFGQSEFDKDISDWDISKAKYMFYMFVDSEFRQDLSKWQIPMGCDTKGMFARNQLDFHPEMQPKGI